MPRANTRQAAASLVTQAHTSGWTSWQLVHAIANQCEVSPLQAARLARGWTLQDAVTALAELGHRATVQQLSSWEHGSSRPSDPRLDSLCRLYQTRPDRLGYGTDYTPPGTEQHPATLPRVTHDENVTAPPVAADTRHAILRSLLGSAGVTLPSPVMTALASVRQEMTHTLTGSIADTTIDQWEDAATEYGQAYQHTPPGEILAGAVLDFAEVRSLLGRSQHADHRSRLCHVAARLAATTGIALVALGEHREARGWFRCAQLAAEETGDRALRAWLVAREAVIPFYYGAPAAAARLAERARLLAGNTLCATAAWAPALEARSLARMGRADDARQAMALAERAFARLDTSHTSDLAYGYTERQLRWHIGSMYTTLGDTRRAQLALDEALSLYAPDEHLDRALIAMDQATSLIGVGEIATAAQVGMLALDAIPAEHRTGIVVSRARDVVAAVPARAARMPVVADLREMIAAEPAPALAG
ncbi:helix-turn-helix transcriptional regulator [Kitasatospora sp. NPDC048545]|uniref:helix-turn-helix transcriptional regulator n=1 Tax=Kitasatospora sp. NPDC048545 TaxID=3157208 RepID=UPI0033E9295C